MFITYLLSKRTHLHKFKDILNVFKIVLRPNKKYAWIAVIRNLPHFLVLIKAYPIKYFLVIFL